MWQSSQEMNNLVNNLRIFCDFNLILQIFHTCKILQKINNRRTYLLYGNYEVEVDSVHLLKTQYMSSYDTINSGLGP